LTTFYVCYVKRNVTWPKCLLHFTYHR